MKKVISLFLVMAMLTGVLAVSFSALSVSDVDDDGVPFVMSAAEGVAAYAEEMGEEVETQRIFFQMPNGKTGPVATDDVMLHHPEELDPETGEVVKEAYDEAIISAGEKAPSWYNDYNVLDGKHYAGIYWWGGTANVDGQWVGYRAEIADEQQGIYYVDLPKDVTTIIWNNGVDGGTDSTKDIYYLAAQTVDTNSEGAYEDEFDTLPYGAPDPDFFDNCIYVVDPMQVSINPFSQKQTCGANWYVYYGNGCYGSEFKEGFGESSYLDGTPDWSDDMQDVCLNPDHYDASGKHVGYHEDAGPTEHVHTPGEPQQENVVPATYKAGGSYDEVVYCTECGEEISRTKKTTDKIELDPNKLYFDSTGTGWEMGAKEKVAFHIYGGDLGQGDQPAGLDWGAKKAWGTAVAGADGLWEFDPAKKLGLTLTPGVQYKIIFCRVANSSFDSAHQTYDLLFTTDCLGHVAYCDGTEYENPVDSSKKTLAAFWYNMDASVVGPVLQISSIGNVVGTCPEAGKTPESIFIEFLTVVDDTTGKTKLANAREFVVDVGTKTEQKMIDDIGTDLGLTKQQVYDAFTGNEVETTWDYQVSTLPGEVVLPTEPATEPPATEHVHTPGKAVKENVVPSTCTKKGSYDSVVYCTECGEEISRTHKTTKMLDHTPGEPVRENEVPATCEHEGSYDSVVYCTECHNEISREHKVIEKAAHTLKKVAAKAPTAKADGWIAHYECTVCGKYFADATGNTELTWDDIVVHYVAPTQKPTQAPTQKPTQKPTEPKVDGKLGDIDQSGEVDIIDATVIQRVDAKIVNATDAMKILGDVDKDGEVTVIDATIIQRWLVGLETNRGIGDAV